MKEFDLYDALKGKEVITRDGQKVTQLSIYYINNKNCLVGVINDKLKYWDFDGYYSIDDKKEHNLDLFMAFEEKSVWVNIYDNTIGLSVGIPHKTYEEAINGIGINKDRYIKTIEITNEI